MNKALFPEYQTLYVVSDLHLGGYSARYGDEERNYRIFRDGEAFAWFVRTQVLDDRQGDRIALVINGDLVDFLALEDATYFDWKGADRKLETILEDSSLKEVWNALAEFVDSGRGDLVVVLGNHDLELALPGPQQILLKRLAGNDPDRRTRVVFAMDGSGFSCLVGGKRVLCTHGNEVDPWNAIEWGRLAFIRRALTRGSLGRDYRLMERWIPNPGTQLVIEHLNTVKRRFQWIDLLKPEQESATMVAAALTGSPAIRTFAEVMSEKGRIEKRLEQGFMGGATRAEPAVEPPLRSRPLSQQEVSELVQSAVTSVARGERPVDLVDAGDEFLLTWSELATAVRSIKLKVWPTSLRETLKTTLVTDDALFHFATPDETSTALDEICSNAIDFLVAGHTHLQRAMERDHAPGTYYFNSGTWIRLARIPREALATADDFERVELRLLHGSMTRLDEEPFRLAQEIRTVVRIARDAACGARGELFNVIRSTAPLAGGGWAMTRVAGSALPKRAAEQS